jgi:hypothetical protein
MKDLLKRIGESLDGFTGKHEKFIFTTLARIIAIGCVILAAYFAWKCSVQIRM